MSISDASACNLRPKESGARRQSSVGRLWAELGAPLPIVTNHDNDSLLHDDLVHVQTWAAGALDEDSVLAGVEGYGKRVAHRVTGR